MLVMAVFQERTQFKENIMMPCARKCIALKTVVVKYKLFMEVKRIPCQIHLL